MGTSCTHRDRRLGSIVQLYFDHTEFSRVSQAVFTVLCNKKGSVAISTQTCVRYICISPIDAGGGILHMKLCKRDPISSSAVNYEKSN